MSEGEDARVLCACARVCVSLCMRVLALAKGADRAHCSACKEKIVLGENRCVCVGV